MALHEAVRNGDAKTVKDLVRLGAYVNETDEEHAGETPLHAACSAGNLQLAKLLIKSGARISLMDKNSCTPVQRACEEGQNLELLQLLRKRVDDVGVLLYWSIKGGWPDGTEYLLSDNAMLDEGRFKDLVRLKRTAERAQCIQIVHKAMQPLPFALSQRQQQSLNKFLEENSLTLRASSSERRPRKISPTDGNVKEKEEESLFAELRAADLDSIGFSGLRRLCSQLGLPQGSHPKKEELLVLLEQQQRELEPHPALAAKIGAVEDQYQEEMEATGMEKLSFGELRSLASALELPQGSNPTRASLITLVRESQNALKDTAKTASIGKAVTMKKASSSTLSGRKRTRSSDRARESKLLRSKRSRSLPGGDVEELVPSRSKGMDTFVSASMSRERILATAEDVRVQRLERELVLQQGMQQQEEQEQKDQREHCQQHRQPQRTREVHSQEQRQQKQTVTNDKSDATKSGKHKDRTAMMRENPTQVSVASRSYETSGGVRLSENLSQLSPQSLDSSRVPRQLLETGTRYMDPQMVLNDFQQKCSTSQQRAMDLEQRLNDLKLSLELERTSKERALQRERQLATDVESMQKLLTDTRGSLNDFRLQWYTEKEAYRVTIDSELKEIEEKRKHLARQESQLDPWMSVIDDGLLEPISIVSQQKQKLEKQKSRISELKRQLNEQILQWEIERKELSFSSVAVTSSPPGAIMQGFWKRTPVALHSISHSKATQSMRSLFKREISVLRRLRHPNLIVCYGVCSQDETLTIVTELCGRSSLKAALCEANKVQLTASRCLNLALQIAKALQFLHEAGVVHNYLMPEHCILTDHWVVKVRGFGIAGVLDVVSPKEVLKCYAYNAPEVFDTLPDLLLRRKEMRKKRDVFSFGVILAQVFTQQQPWKDVTQQAVAQRVVRGERAFSPLPHCIPSRVRSLITSCWDHEPEKRPSFEDIALQLQQWTT